jgi:CheY-like chemotaxis protein
MELTQRDDVSPPPAGKKILLVDDEELVRRVLAHLLSDAGFTVEQAENGASGLQLGRRMNGSLSLVISDVNMPIMDGLEFAAALRKTDAQVPFLFITAVDPALIYEAGLQSHILMKPFTPDVFLETVARIVSQSSQFA